MPGPEIDEIAYPLADLDVFTVRPADPSTRALVAALRADGARVVNLSPLRLAAVDASEFIDQWAALRRDASHWLFTSPAAVRVAARLARRTDADVFGDHEALAQAAAVGGVFAPGPGTASALAKLGIAAQIPSQRFDSEGLLALPGLAAPLTGHVVLVGAPQGRGLLQPTLLERGARVSLLNVYRRRAQPLPARQLAALAATANPLLIASSQAMLDALAAQLGERRWMHLSPRAQLVVSSARLSEHAAKRLGFRHVSVAQSARPDHLHQAALAMAKTPHRQGQHRGA